MASGRVGVVKVWCCGGYYYGIDVVVECWAFYRMGVYLACEASGQDHTSFNVRFVHCLGVQDVSSLISLGFLNYVSVSI